MTLTDYLAAKQPPDPEPERGTIWIDGSAPPIEMKDFLAGVGRWKDGGLLQREREAAERAESRARAREFLHPTLVGPEEAIFDSEEA